MFIDEAIAKLKDIMPSAAYIYIILSTHSLYIVNRFANPNTYPDTYYFYYDTKNRKFIAMKRPPSRPFVFTKALLTLAGERREHSFWDRIMKCAILDVLALYGCKNPGGAKGKDVSLLSNVLRAIYRYVGEQYMIFIGHVRHRKHLKLMIEHENKYCEIGSRLRVFAVNSKNMIIKSSRNIRLEDLRGFIPNANKIHSDEYQNLLSIIEKLFISRRWGRLLAYLDSTLNYYDLFNALKKYLRDLDQCSIGLTQRVREGIEVYRFEKSSN